MEEESKDYKQEDWQRHYEANDMGWDLGQVAPPFVKLWEDKKLPLGKVLIPGCGRGHDVLFLAGNGFEVTAVDFSEGAGDAEAANGGPYTQCHRAGTVVIKTVRGGACPLSWVGKPPTV